MDKKNQTQIKKSSKNPKKKKEKNYKPGHQTIGLNAMFEAVKLPARITDLDSSLTDMKTDNLPHPESKPDLSQGGEGWREKRERE